MAEAIDVMYDIFWALMISISILAFLIIAVVIGLVAAASWIVNYVRRNRWADVPQDEEIPKDDHLDSVRLRTVDSTFKEAA